MKNFQKITKKEYGEFLGKALFKTFFHSLEWHEFLEQQFKWLKFEYYLYKNEALFPLAIIGKKLISLPFCEYGGPLPLKHDIKIDEFERDVLEEFKNIKIKFHPRVSNPTGKIELSLSILSSHWRGDLKNISEKELWDSLRKTLRHEIKHAQEQNLKIKKCENLKELKAFYNLYVANLRYKKTVPYPWPLIQFLYKNAPNELLLAFYRGEIVGGSLFLEYSGFVHYFLSASDYKYKNLGVSYFILWEKIKSLIGKDVIFDLGASPRDSNLEIFKRGWGGTEYPIYQIGIKREDESLRSSKLRNIWGLLPNFVIKKISSYFIKYRI